MAPRKTLTHSPAAFNRTLFSGVAGESAVRDEHRAALRRRLPGHDGAAGARRGRQERQRAHGHRAVLKPAPGCETNQLESRDIKNLISHQRGISKYPICHKCTGYSGSESQLERAQGTRGRQSESYPYSAKGREKLPYTHELLKKLRLNALIDSQKRHAEHRTQHFLDKNVLLPFNQNSSRR